jgi:hypothetical protein
MPSGQASNCGHERRGLDEPGRRHGAILGPRTVRRPTRGQILTVPMISCWSIDQVWEAIIQRRKSHVEEGCRTPQASRTALKHAASHHQEAAKHHEAGRHETASRVTRPGIKKPDAAGPFSAIHSPPEPDSSVAVDPVAGFFDGGSYGQSQHRGHRHLSRWI